MNTKFCPHCKQVRPTSAFYSSTHQSGGFRVYCKECTLERTRIDKKKHPLKYRKWQRTTHQRLKELVLTYYGNGEYACVKCGESRPSCLTIDHIDGDGAVKRRRISDWHQSGYGFYRWLRDNHYPEGYQTLCHNCQWIKRDENREGYRMGEA